MAPQAISLRDQVTLHQGLAQLYGTKADGL